MATERGNLQKLIRQMKARGFVVSSVFDGEGTTHKFPNEADTLDAIFAVDESSLRFRKSLPDGTYGKRHGVLVVLGNSPEEVCADWNYSEGDADGFGAAMDAITATFN